MKRNCLCNIPRKLHMKRIVLLTLVLSLLMSSIVFPVFAAESDSGVTTVKVVLRKRADKDSVALQTLPEGEEVTITGTQGSWYKVRYGKFSGYIMKKYVKVSSSSSAKTQDKIKDSGTPPGAMRIGDETSDVKKLQQALEILGYYEGRIDGIYGDGTAEAVKAYQKKKGLDADGVAGPDTVKSIFGSCSKTTLSPSILAEQKGGSSKTTVAVSTRSSSTAKTSGKTVSSIAEIGSVPGTSRPGSSGSDVVKLQQALECLGYYDGAIDGVYGDETVNAVKKFQRKRSMNPDGIAGASTIRVLFGSSPKSSSSSSKTSSTTKATASSSSKKYKTEVVDWFKDDVTHLIPKNAVFTVKDVYTGRTFSVRRWAGYNHLDAEPVSASDSATMKAIYGGSWSWRRRPILVMYNGHVYAASMNGMPHGDDTISGNNFDGHFCIHFKNSKTHGTKKVDKDHQNAVNIASKYAW